MSRPQTGTTLMLALLACCVAAPRPAVAALDGARHLDQRLLPPTPATTRNADDFRDLARAAIRPNASIELAQAQPFGAAAQESPGFFKRLGNAGSGMAKKAGSIFKKPKPDINSSTINSNDPLSLNNKAKQPDAEFYIRVAQLQEQAGNRDGADAHYRKALAMAPKHHDALLAYARFKDRGQDNAAATKLFQAVIESYPQDPTAYNDLALCLARQGRLAEAVQALEQAIQLAPDRKLYRNNLGRIYADAGRREEALAHLIAAHGEAVAHYNLGYLLAERGDLQAARYHFRRALEERPNFPEAEQWQAILAARMGMTAEAPTATASNPVANPVDPAREQTDRVLAQSPTTGTPVPAPHVPSPQENVVPRIAVSSTPAVPVQPATPTPESSPSVAPPPSISQPAGVAASDARPAQQPPAAPAPTPAWVNTFSDSARDRPSADVGTAPARPARPPAGNTAAAKPLRSGSGAASDPVGTVPPVELGHARPRPAYYPPSRY